MCQEFRVALNPCAIQGSSFVIDSADHERLPIVKAEITQMLNHEDMDDKKVMDSICLYEKQRER